MLNYGGSDEAKKQLHEDFDKVFGRAMIVQPGCSDCAYRIANTILEVVLISINLGMSQSKPEDTTESNWIVLVALVGRYWSVQEDTKGFQVVPISIGRSWSIPEHTRGPNKIVQTTTVVTTMGSPGQ